MLAVFGSRCYPKPNISMYQQVSLRFPIGCIVAMTFAVAMASAADDTMVLGDHQLGLTLDKNGNYAVRSVFVQGTEFRSGGKFPCFVLFDRQGKEEPFSAGDARWKTSVKTNRNGLTITYSCSGLIADVTYSVTNDAITISSKVVSEGDLKVRALTDGGSLVSIPSDVAGAKKSGFVVRPFNSGEVIRFPANKEQRVDAHAQDWNYHATFFGLGYNSHGLIVRCPQYGGIWSAGTGDVNGVYSLMGGLTADYRPRRDQPGPYAFWNLPLVESQIDVVLYPVADANGDGVFNWVDVGVTYRHKQIRRNRLLDKSELTSVSGKLDTWAAHPNYAELLRKIRTIDWAPQRWWLVGPPVPVGNEFTYPCYSDSPDPSHNGPGGYDYFQFKRDCAKLGVKIGLHEMFQDVCQANAREWKKTPIRVQEYGEPMSTWSGTTPQGVCWDFSKALAPVVKDGSFFRTLDRHLKDWDVGAGDTWHWDCFTAFGGRSDFSPDHPITHGADIRTRIDILKYIQQKGIHFGSEGLQEGMAEWCGFAWTAKTEPGWKSPFAAGEAVPLVPVLFQGMTYYYVTWYPAWNLLMGGKEGYEADSMKLANLRNGYFGSAVYWGKIADRTVKNMIKTAKGWRVEYTEGGSLTVDLANMTPAMTFVLEIDGQKYTSANPPASPWGVKARLIRSPNREYPDGEYEPVYPPRWQRR